MKKRQYLLSLAAAILALTGCSTTRMAKFTSIENLLSLKTGVTLEETIATLGSKPYDIYINQGCGYIIYEYKYKVIEREVAASTVNTKGGETAGTEVYAGKLNSVFLFFKDGKLETFITDKGRKDGLYLVTLDHTLCTVTLDKNGQYILMPAEPDKQNGGIKGLFKFK